MLLSAGQGAGCRSEKWRARAVHVEAVLRTILSHTSSPQITVKYLLPFHAVQRSGAPSAEILATRA